MKRTAMFLAAFGLLSSTLSAQSYSREHLIRSEFLKEDRVISVSLPEGYSKDNRSYPVLYILDGEHAFSYARGAVDFLTNDFGYLPKMIVVGVANTDRNRDLYVSLQPDGGYLQFLKFLKVELFAFIEENYRINAFTTLFGWSSGSGICNYVLTVNPDLVDGYILAGSGIGPNTAKFIEENLSDTSYENKFLYVNTEGEGPRRKGLELYQVLLDSLNPRGLTKKFEIIEETDHVDVMAKGIYEGLKFVFSSFYIPEDNVLKGYEDILNYYKVLKDRYGFEVQIPIGAINESAGLLSHHNQAEDALRLLNYGILLHPDSATLYGALGKHYLTVSNIEMAKKYYKMALDKSRENHSKHLKYKALLETLNP